MGKNRAEEEERRRIAAIKRQGRSPDICGDSVVRVAPARGRVVTFAPAVMMPDGKDGFKAVDMGYRGRLAMRQEDVFDRMADQARRRKAGAPFDLVLVDVARDYRDLSEKVAAAGYKCSSAFDQAPTGGGAGDFMDAYASDAARLRQYHRAIGDGAAMELRRVRPSERGSRKTIFDRPLVDLVALGDMSMSDVLRRHGWQSGGKNITRLRGALCAILERMRGV